jgi:hypothetical protein
VMKAYCAHGASACAAGTSSGWGRPVFRACAPGRRIAPFGTAPVTGSRMKFPADCPIGAWLNERDGIRRAGDNRRRVRPPGGTPSRRCEKSADVTRRDTKLVKRADLPEEQRRHVQLGQIVVFRSRWPSRPLSQFLADHRRSPADRRSAARASCPPHRNGRERGRLDTRKLLTAGIHATHGPCSARG